jgi:hypothetical protein
MLYGLRRAVFVTNVELTLLSNTGQDLSFGQGRWGVEDQESRVESRSVWLSTLDPRPSAVVLAKNRC